MIETTISQIKELENPLKASLIPVLDFKLDIAVLTFSSISFWDINSRAKEFNAAILLSSISFCAATFEVAFA